MSLHVLTLVLCAAPCGVTGYLQRPSFKPNKQLGGRGVSITAPQRAFPPTPFYARVCYLCASARWYQRLYDKRGLGGLSTCINVCMRKLANERFTGRPVNQRSKSRCSSSLSCTPSWFVPGWCHRAASDTAALKGPEAETGGAN